VLRAQLPPEFFLLDGPWPTLPRVALRPLDTSRVKERSLRQWTEADLVSAATGPSVRRPIPSQLRGVLVAPATGEPSTYVFYGPAAATAYFVSDGRGQNFIKGWKRQTAEGRTLEIDAAQFTPEIADRWGLTRAVHLADVEVNSGKGDASNDGHFVITNVRVLDGTEVFPVDLAAATAALDARARTKLVASLQGAQPELARARQKLPADARPSAPTESFRWTAAWDEAGKELRLTFFLSRVEHYLSPARPVERHCPAGMPCAQQLITPEFTIRVVAAVDQRLSAAGELTAETVYGAQVQTE